jgi:hypothetical protein
MSRTALMMYEDALRKCRQVASATGDHTFECTQREALLLQNEPFRSAIGASLCRDITGRPQRICGLLIKVKEDQRELQENRTGPL